MPMKLNIPVSVAVGWPLALFFRFPPSPRRREASDIPGHTENFYWRFSSVKFPILAKKIPVPQNIFPVSLHREFLEKWLQQSSFLQRNRP